MTANEQVLPMLGDLKIVRPVLLLGLVKNLKLRTNAERNSSAGTKAK